MPRFHGGPSLRQRVAQVKARGDPGRFPCALGTVIPGWCPPPAPSSAECGTTNTRYAIDAGGGEVMIGWECPNGLCLRDGEELPEIRWPFEDTGRFSQLEELGFRIR